MSRAHWTTKRRRGAPRGFTLVEIMLVLAIIGVLSTFAIPYFQKATARARKAELQLVLPKLETYFINNFENTGTFVTATTPAGFTSEVNPDPTTAAIGQSATWKTTRNGFQQIPFSFEGGVKMRYSYVIAADGLSLTIVAEGAMPGLGAAFTANGGNYYYSETLVGPTINQFENPPM